MDIYLNSGQVEQGLATAKAAIEASRAAGQRPSDELYGRPIKALQAAKRTNEVLDLMALRLRDYNQPTVWRQTLFIALQANQDKEVGLDIFRLMRATRSEEHTSELQSLMRISYAVFCLKKKKNHIHIHITK